MSYLISIERAKKDEDVMDSGFYYVIGRTYQCRFLFDYFNIDPYECEHNFYFGLTKTRWEDIKEKLKSNEFNLEEDERNDLIKRYEESNLDFENYDYVIYFEILSGSILKSEGISFEQVENYLFGKIEEIIPKLVEDEDFINMVFGEEEEDGKQTTISLTLVS